MLKRALDVCTPRVIRKHTNIRRVFYERGIQHFGNVLNIGSRETSFGEGTVNIDLNTFRGVHAVADAHSLPFRDESFDTCMLSAVLQYCADPGTVVREASRVLKPGGFLVIDAPFMQPYCPEDVATDYWRFTEPGLRRLIPASCLVLLVKVSIGGGSAMAYTAQTWADSIQHRGGRGLARLCYSWAAWPLSWLSRADPGDAGAFILVARKW